MCSDVKTPKTKKTLEPKIDNSFKLKEISPLTETQKEVFSKFDEGQNLIMMGTAGTGKTFCSAYLALKSLMERKNSVDHPSRVLFIRSVVSTLDVGFLPGTLKEKLAVYEAPYKGIFAELLQRGDAWEILKTKGIVDFQSTSYLRGTTITDTFIVVDEFQNMNLSELDTIISRVGKNSKLIFCGDLEQTDLTKSKFDVTGLPKFVSIIQKMPSFSVVEFGVEDIVRSGIVKEYIIAKRDLGIGCVLE